jgi:hypothetical protein
MLLYESNRFAPTDGNETRFDAFNVSGEAID